MRDRLREHEGAGAARGLYRLWLNGETCEVLAPFRGEYGTENSIAAAAAAHLLGLSAEEIAQGFARAALPPQRFTRSRVDGWELIDDTYNANPLSMRRMLGSRRRAGLRPDAGDGVG